MTSSRRLRLLFTVPVSVADLVSVINLIYRSITEFVLHIKVAWMQHGSLNLALA